MQGDHSVSVRENWIILPQNMPYHITKLGYYSVFVNIGQPPHVLLRVIVHRSKKRHL